MTSARRAYREYEDPRDADLLLPLPQKDTTYRPYVIPARGPRHGSRRERDGPRRGRTPSSVLRAALDHIMLQWTLAYLAAAWLGLQLMDVLAEIWTIPVTTQRFVCLTLALGIFPALVVAWFHGERGKQRVCGLEATLVGVLVFGAGIVLWAVFGG